jgi:hypothetical protein
MSLTADYFVACEAHAEHLGRHSLINVFDAVHFPGFPSHLPKCCLVARLRGDPGEYTGRLRFIASSTEEDVVPPLPEVHLKVEDGLRPSAFMVFELAGLPLPREGFYTFALEMGESRAADCEILARQIPGSG